MKAGLEILKNLDDNSKKLIKKGIIVAVVLIVLIIIISIVVSIMNRRISYEDMETVMAQAAYKYYQDNLGQLPTEEVKNVVVSAQTLVEKEYMKPIQKYTKDSSCTGDVVVTYVNGDYDYQGYLTCTSFKTSLLVDKIKKDNQPVTSGEGIYDENGVLRFRGEHINNYIRIGDNIYRIMKIDTEDRIYITPNSSLKNYTYWDDRYNSEKQNSSGINEYVLSRIKDTLENIYENMDKELKENITPYNLCIGKRAIKDTVNDSSIECSAIYENQMIGLMPLYEYIKASVAPSCVSSESRECKNYNYLVNDEKFWTITALKEDTFNVFFIKYNGEIVKDYASGKKEARFVVALKPNVVLKTGNGTEENPYTIR